MSFRSKVALATAIAVGVSVWAVTVAATLLITESFKIRDAERTHTLVEQVRREFQSRGRELARRVEVIASSGETARIASALSEPRPDTAPFLNDASTLAHEQTLDFLVIAASDTAVISSAQWPARFDYKEEWLSRAPDWEAVPAFLKRESLPDQTNALGLFVVRTIRVPGGLMYIAGGQRISQAYLESLAIPPGMSLTFWDATSPPPTGLEDFTRRIDRAGEQLDAPTLTAIPLRGRDGEFLGALIARNSQADLLSLIAYTRTVALIVGAAGVLLGAALSWWLANRVTRPVAELARSVRAVSAGDWAVRADVQSNDEIGELASDFNRMTGQLIDQKERMVQSERVAAWRELARRLAHELKNPLFPLQITVENLQRSRGTKEFDEVFTESTTTLLAELQNLKTIIGRFSDFSKMPAPQLEPVNLNSLITETANFFSSQFPITLALDSALPEIQADPDQLRRALRNLVLNALDAMPNGGTLTIRTTSKPNAVLLEVIDTGQGLTPEECERLFTPYYTTKQHGTGLGLAIVQSVIADHKGSIHVDSESGRGTAFRIELPLASDRSL